MCMREAIAKSPKLRAILYGLMLKILSSSNYPSQNKFNHTRFYSSQGRRLWNCMVSAFIRSGIKMECSDINNTTSLKKMSFIASCWNFILENLHGMYWPPITTTNSISSIWEKGLLLLLYTKPTSLSIKNPLSTTSNPRFDWRGLELQLLPPSPLFFSSSLPLLRLVSFCFVFVFFFSGQ